MTNYILGLLTIPCVLSFFKIYSYLSILIYSIQYSLFEYRVVKLANIACPEFADTKEVTRQKLWKRFYSELKRNLRYGKPDNNYNNNTLEDKAGNVYHFRGWRKPRVIRREGPPSTAETVNR